MGSPHQWRKPKRKQQLRKLQKLQRWDACHGSLPENMAKQEKNSACAWTCAEFELFFGTLYDSHVAAVRPSRRKTGGESDESDESDES